MSGAIGTFVIGQSAIGETAAPVSNLGTAAYPTPIQPFPVSYGIRPAAAGSQPSVAPMSFPFGLGVGTYVVSMQSNFTMQNFGMVQTLFIDNSQSAAVTTVTFPMGGETITADPFTRGFYPCISNGLTFNVSNSTPNISTVKISAYNFIVPPVVTNTTQLIVGGNDTPTLARAGTMADCIYVSGGLENPTVSAKFYGHPYYYITGFSIMYSAELSGASNSFILYLYDMIDGNPTNFSNTFWQGIVSVPSTGGSYLVASVNNVLLQGSGRLALIAQNDLNGSQGTVNVNIYGGITNAQI